MNPDNPNFREQKWIVTRTLWPKTCSFTGRKIHMGTKCYHLHEGRNAHGLPRLIETDTWCHYDEFTFLKLKGEV